MTGPRLWFPMIAPAAAWAAEGLFGWWAGAQICTSMSISGVRASVTIVSLVMLTVAVAALVMALSNWRESGARSHAESDRIEFISLGGVLVSSAFVVGIAWSGLSAAMLNVCGGMR